MMLLACTIILLVVCVAIQHSREQRTITRERAVAACAVLATQRSIEISRLNALIAAQHNMIVTMINEREKVKLKIDEITELLPTEFPIEEIPDHKQAAVVMFQMVEKVKALVDAKLPRDHQLSLELKEILK